MKIIIKNNSMLNIVISLFIFLSSSFLTVSCTKNNTSNGPKEFTYEGKEMEIKGLVEKYENESLKTFSIVENPESKSRKTYILIGLNDKEYKELSKYLNQIIKVKLKIIQQISPWTFKAKLIKIL
ncbi:MAG: hypothetical protein N3A58_04475 [Spirochaetes bacterium]|nr:hypothetical protein [Spirochaetota bacterium]